MTFKFSNRNQWQILCIEFAIGALIALFSSVILLRIWAMALLFFILGITCVIYAINFYSKHLQDYLSIDDQRIWIHSLVDKKEKTVPIASIKKLIHKGNLISIYTEDGLFYEIHLNYMDAEDIKKLLMYLRYTPTITQKII